GETTAPRSLHAKRRTRKYALTGNASRRSEARDRAARFAELRPRGTDRGWVRRVRTTEPAAASRASDAVLPRLDVARLHARVARTREALEGIAGRSVRLAGFVELFSRLALRIRSA